MKLDFFSHLVHDEERKKHYWKCSTEIDATVVVVVVIVVVVVVKTLTDQPVIVEEDAFYGRPHISFNFIMHVAVHRMSPLLKKSRDEKKVEYRVQTEASKHRHTRACTDMHTHIYTHTYIWGYNSVCTHPFYFLDGFMELVWMILLVALRYKSASCCQDGGTEMTCTKLALREDRWDARPAGIEKI